MTFTERERKTADYPVTVRLDKITQVLGRTTYTTLRVDGVWVHVNEKYADVMRKIRDAEGEVPR